MIEYINKGKKIVTDLYEKYDEDSRLIKSRHGQLEYFTTMEYIHKYLKKGAKILEIGAGTGRYSITLAREGYDVTAIELVKKNVLELKENSKDIKNIKSYQGDALNLTRFSNESFDMVLSLGPMYHLYTQEDQLRAIDEALRVCKKNGIVMCAFIPIHAFIYCAWMENNEVGDGIRENFTEDFKPKQYKEQGFTGFEISDFKKLFKDKNVKKLKLIATDSVLEIEEDRKNFSIPDKDWDLFKRYHLATCEKPELQGLSSHLLYIVKKQ